MSRELLAGLWLCVVDSSLIKQIEAALIFEYQPAWNLQRGCRRQGDKT